MYLHERLENDNAQQMAFLISLLRDEWTYQLIDNQLEPAGELLDPWIDFGLDLARSIFVPKQRVA